MLRHGHHALRDEVIQALHRLPDRERRIIELHFGLQGEPHTLAQIGNELGLARERVRQMGGTTEGTMEEFLKKATIKEAPGENPDAMGMIKELLDGHETVIRALRVAIDKCFEEFKDQGTGNFLTDLMEKHEKTAWMLRSYTK